MNKYKKEQEAYKKIYLLIDEAAVKVKEAEKIADDHHLEFRMCIGADRGMDGFYHGKGSDSDHKNDGEWVSSTERCNG